MTAARRGIDVKKREGYRRARKPFAGNVDAKSISESNSTARCVYHAVEITRAVGCQSAHEHRAQGPDRAADVILLTLERLGGEDRSAGAVADLGQSSPVMSEGRTPVS